MMAVGSLPKAVFDGNDKEGSFLAGQAAGMIKEEQSACEIVEDIMQGAEKILSNAANFLKG